MVNTALCIDAVAPLYRVSFVMLNHLLEELSRPRDITGLNDRVATVDTRERIDDRDLVVIYGAINHYAYVLAEILGKDRRLGLRQKLQMQMCYTVATIRTLERHRIVAVVIVALALPVVIVRLGGADTYRVVTFLGIMYNERHLVDTVLAVDAGQTVEIIARNGQCPSAPVLVRTAFAHMRCIVHMEIFRITDIEPNDRVAFAAMNSIVE